MIKRKQIIIATIVIGIISFAFLAYTVLFAANDSAVIKYGLDADPLNLDPQKATDCNSLMVIQSIYEGLFKIDNDGKLTEGVVESYNLSKDKKLYTFHLKKDSGWHSINKNDFNGNIITAHDFVFAFRRLLNPTTGSVAANNFFTIENAREVNAGNKSITDLGIYALDDFTLRIKLENPDESFLYLLTTAPAMPCNEEFFNSTTGNYGLEADAVLSNGAFYLHEWIHDDYLRLRSNEYYKGQSPKPPGVSFLIGDSEKMQKYFDDNVTHAILSPTSNFDTTLNSQSFESVTWGFVFGNKKRWRNADLRESLQLTVNHDIMDEYLPVEFSKAEGLIPPSISGIDTSFREFAGEILPKNDISRAKKKYKSALKQLGVEKLSKVTVIMPENTANKYNNILIENFSHISQIWQSQLGLFPAIKEYSLKDFEAKVKSGSFDIAIYPFTASYDSPRSVLDNFIDIKANTPAYLQNAMNRAEKALTNKKRMENYKQAENYIIKNHYVIPLYFQKEYFIMNKGIRDIIFFPGNKLIDFTQAYR